MGLSDEQENTCLKANDSILNEQHDLEGGEGKQGNRGYHPDRDTGKVE